MYGMAPGGCSGVAVQDEWLDAAEEAKRGRLRWLASDDGVTPSAADARPPADPEEEELPGPRKPPPHGHAAVGCTIGVWWIDDAQYYFGRVQEYDPETSEGLRHTCPAAHGLTAHHRTLNSCTLWQRMECDPDTKEGTYTTHDPPGCAMDAFGETVFHVQTPCVSSCLWPHCLTLVPFGVKCQPAASAPQLSCS